MSSSTAFLVMTWVWLAAGLTVFCLILYVAFKDLVVDLQTALIFVGLLTVSAGLTAAGTALLGWPLAALWIVRVTSLISVVAALMLGPISWRRSSGPRTYWSFGAAAVFVGMAALAFICEQWPSPTGTATPAKSVPGATPTLPPAATSAFVFQWHQVALGLFALALIAFLALFVASVRRSGPPRIDSHWGGIGGGLAGWRMSPSLGYLIVLGAIGVLFTALLFRYEPIPGGLDKLQTEVSTNKPPTQKTGG